MSELKTLIKKDLILHFGWLLNLKAAFSNKRQKKVALTWAVLLVIGLIYGNIVFSFFNSITGNQVDNKTAQSLISLLIISYTFLTIITSGASINSSIFYSNDVKILMRLPVKSKNILRARMMTETLSSLGYAVFFVFPSLISIGIKRGEDILYYIFALFGLVFITLAIISIFSYISVAIIGLLSKIPNFKNKLKYFQLLLAFLIIIGSQIGTRLILSANILDFSAKIENYLPHAAMFSKSLISTSPFERMLALGAIILLAILFLLIFSKLGSKLMMKAILSENSSATKKAKEKKAKRNRVYFDIMKNEIQGIFKTPIYFFNIALFGIIMPVAMLAPFISSKDLSLDIIYKARDFVSRLDLTGLVAGSCLFLGLIMAMFLCGTGQSAVSAISREGKTMWILRVLPIRGEDIVKGKVLASYLFQVISLIPSFLILVIFIKPKLFMILLILLGAFTAMTFTNLSGLMVDISYPKLEWDNPQEAVKQNFVTAVYSIAMIGLSVLIGIVVFNIIEDNVLAYNGILISALTVLLLMWLSSIIIYKKLPSYLEKRMRSYE